MWPDRVSNPGPPTYESGALPIALRGPASRKVGISLSTVHLSLKKHLKVRNISARLVPHLLTDQQKRQRVEMVIKLLQMFPKYDKKQFPYIVTGDETWVHYFEPVRKVNNNIWATKQQTPNDCQTFF